MGMQSSSARRQRTHLIYSAPVRTDVPSICKQSAASRARSHDLPDGLSINANLRAKRAAHYGDFLRRLQLRAYYRSEIRAAGHGTAMKARPTCRRAPPIWSG